MRGNVRVTQELVVRESDGRTLLLVAGYIGDNPTPVFTRAFEPDPAEDAEPP